MKLQLKYRKRLSNVIRALRESPDPRMFRMGSLQVVPGDFVRKYQALSESLEPSRCGYPACNLGHYAARRDLQRTFRLLPEKGAELVVRTSNGDTPKGWYAPGVRSHFGLGYNEFEELFGAYGCGGATTTRKAIAYLTEWLRTRGGVVAS